jgi:hypothetical protein
MQSPEALRPGSLSPPPRELGSEVRNVEALDKVARSPMLRRQHAPPRVIVNLTTPHTYDSPPRWAMSRR